MQFLRTLSRSNKVNCFLFDCDQNRPRKRLQNHSTNLRSQGSYSSITFLWIVTLLDFIQGSKQQDHCKLHQRKVLLSSFYVNFLSHRISVIRRQNTTTTLYSVIKSVTGEYCSVAFKWIVTPWDFIHRVKS